MRVGAPRGKSAPSGGFDGICLAALLANACSVERLTVKTAAVTRYTAHTL